MSIRVAERDCFPESHLAVRQLHGSGRDESGPAVPESLRGFVHTDPQKSGLPVNQVVSLLLRRKRAPIARRQVFEELNSRTRAGSQRGDVQAGAKDIIEPLLLGTVVLTLPSHFHAEAIPIELQTCL